MGASCGRLEREGIAHDVFAESHLAHGELELDDYKVLIISAHPEYWTREMVRPPYSDSTGPRGGRARGCGRTQSDLREVACVPLDTAVLPGQGVGSGAWGAADVPPPSHKHGDQNPG